MFFVLMPLKIYCNNSIAIYFSHSTKCSSHFKYIDIRYLFVRDKIAWPYVNSWLYTYKLILIDPLTKSLSVKGASDSYGIIRVLFYTKLERALDSIISCNLNEIIYYSYFVIMHGYCYLILICHILCTHLVRYGIMYIMRILWFETFCLVSIRTLWTKAFWLGFNVLYWDILLQSHYNYKKA